MAAVPGYNNDDYSNVDAAREDKIAADSEEGNYVSQGLFHICIV
jgi:hypothetical protein